MKKVLFLLCSFLSPLVFSQATSGVSLPGLSVNFGQGVDLVDTMQVLALFTILTLAPAIIILCTSFTRIIVILSFMRQAIGTQSMPPNQLLVGLALFLSVFVMMPTGKNIYEKSINPYMNKTISTTQALTGVESELRLFMQSQVRKADIGLFYDV
ncbi:MAG: flagellar biosynthetic protein FliP, partial [Halobacteriovoraceae bacterium]|nr:flagellar biosynthetic protein FliP [Halobacteriovoraceae bacterium]